MQLPGIDGLATLASFLARPLQGGATVARDLDIVAREGEPKAEHLRHVRIVLDEKDRHA
jgi:hypothetical protein